MRIGELAKRSGLTASRIRFYEASGLLQVVDRKANGYREYGPEALVLLEIIAGAQSAGFSLDEIRHLLPDGSETCKYDDMVVELRRKVEEIERMQETLEQNKQRLLRAIDTIAARPEDLARDDKKQWVLERLRSKAGAS